MGTRKGVETMKRKMKKWLTMLLAMMLVVTSVDLASISTQAATNITPTGSAEDKSWTADKLTKEWGNATSAVNGDQMEITFESTYAQVRLTLPESIDTANCNSATFAVSQQSGPVAFKLYVEGEEDAGWVKYSRSGSTLYEFTDLPEGKITKIGLMLNDESLESMTCIFDGIYFDMKDSAAPTVTPGSNITPAGDAEDKSWTADKLTKEWGDATSALNGDKMNLSFESEYAQVRLLLPEAVDMSECESVTFAVSEQSGPIALKLYVEGESEAGWVKYSQSGNTLYKYTELPTGKVTKIGLMWNDTSLTSLSSVFDGIYFDMKKGAEPTPAPTEVPSSNITPAGDAEDKSWTADKLTKEWGDATSSLDGDKMNLSFETKYAQLCLLLPEAMDMANCESVTFAVSEQSGPIAFKLYVEGESEAGWVKYSQSGNTLYEYTELPTGKVTKIGLMWNDSSIASLTSVFDGIYFNMKKAGTVEPTPTPTPTPTPGASENITPAVTGAEDKSWKSDVLPEIYNTTTASLNNDAARWNISFTGNWQEIRFKLPESIDLSKTKSVTFAVPEQSAGLSFKLYSGETEVWAQYSASGKTLYTYDFSAATAVIDTMAIMMHADDKVNATETCSFDGVVFDVMSEDEIIETYEVNYGYSDLVLDWSNATSCSLVENGYLIKFAALNDEARFKLPEGINLEKCQAIIFKVASQNGPVNFYLGSDSTKLETYYYNVGKTEYSKAPTTTNKVNTITVQCGGEEYTADSNALLTGVTFVMEGKKPLPTPADGVYNTNYFEFENATAGVSTIVNEEAGTTHMSFASVGDSVTFAIPDSVDVNHLTTITMNGVAVETLKIEVLNADGEVIATAAGNVAETKCNPEAKSIRFTSVNANTVVDLNNVAFNVDPDAFEAIVLNGYFTRDDVSMWGAQIWGSVDDVPTEITVKESETPIFDDVYTYAEINRRSSPYVSFAQDISSRVEPGKYYDYTFYAKLSDDYKDAPAEQRIVEFSPYYMDEGGSAKYGLQPKGIFKVDVVVGNWVKFHGYFYVPEGSTGYIFRIVEQGTNYGNGACVLGSYAIAGVEVKEHEGTLTWGPVTMNGGGGGGGAATVNTTITKEATWAGEYNMEELLVEWGSATYEKNKDNSLSINFKNNYDEVRMDLPRELDMSAAAYIKTKVASQNVPIAVKLYYKGSQVDVAYYNNQKSEYIMVPAYTGMIDAIGIMSLATPNPKGAFAKFSGIEFGLTAEPAPIPPRASIVLNGDFSDPDLSDWKASFWGDGVTMTQKTSSTAIAPGIYNYGEYSKRTSPYQCYAQDITEAVEEGETYTFSFWAKLSNDYVGAPDAQRIIQFAPYTTDSDGVSDYNPKLEGTYLQVCEPGVWTYFEGKYKVTNPNDVKKVVIRIVEQGTNYGQGDCVLGSYSVTGVKMEKFIPEPPSIDEDVPNLKDALTAVFGEDFIAGTAMTIDEIDDIGIDMLVNKHFNAITVGNELKPDALFNYSNGAHTELQTISFNGQSLEVPTLSFYRAEELLDTVLEWNERHPETPIKMRGHVLVWHSQTPEWFFRENYVVGQNADGTENYVTPEVMNLRLEWFIKTVLEHFTGEDSPYKDLFYGWDVVNEAVSNGGGGYRTNTVSAVESPSADTHSSNSSWWAVYQSNEFIINAFKYANMYAPADVELYYNDYNECDNKKSAGIVKLLKDVKEAEGTRIDGVGMQGHYNMFNPSPKAFEAAIRAYAEVVGKVMLTELDMKVSGDISTDEKKQAEYAAQGDRYRDLYEVLKALKEEGIDISGITVWGTVDKYSWLQSSSSVGGGADGDLTQCPLLFDDNYKVKPSFWAFVDYSSINPDYVAPTLSTAVKEEVKEPEKEEEKTQEETKEEVAEATPAPTPETKPVEDVTAPAEEEGGSMAPVAIGGGVAGVGIIAAIVAWLKKRKGVKTEK